MKIRTILEGSDSSSYAKYFAKTIIEMIGWNASSKDDLIKVRVNNRNIVLKVMET